MKPLFLILSMFIFASCSNGDYQPPQNTPQGDFDELVAVVAPTMGNSANGVVRFMKQDDGIRVIAEIHDLEPNSTHGFHIHQYGDCSAMDGTSAGGHFNPTDAPHAGPDADTRHAGDLGNLTADENGTAEIDFVDDNISFEGATSVLGRGIIVHAGEDDLVSQPTGDAGARLGCGVVGIAQTN